MTKNGMIADAREVVLRAWRDVVRNNPHDLQVIADARWGGAFDVLRAIGGCDSPSDTATPGLIYFETLDVEILGIKEKK